jgi:hypothetical protein
VRQRIVETDGDFAGSGGDRLGIADMRGQTPNLAADLGPIA